MSYLLLALAIIAEIVATTFLKFSEGFTKLFPSVLSVVSYIVCYYSFSKAVTKINLGIAYATWCGAGIIVTAVISFIIFKEKLSMAGVVGIILITAGCIILNAFGSK
ncbi:MAG: multidrug efflux SMR transporter [Eubacteriales bacterium]|nr:multidrug efflux SMR transporter [Eubacteriales bacterium]